MTKVVIFHKDVLVKFSYEIIEYLCQINNVEIESINNTEYKQDQELTDDLIQLITIFANKL